MAGSILMPELALAPGERMLDRREFRYSTLLFFLRRCVITTDRRVVARSPFLFLIIPVGSATVSVPLSQVADVRFGTRVSIPLLLIGLVLLPGLTMAWPLWGCAAALVVCLCLASVQTGVTITNTGGGRIAFMVGIFDQDSAEEFAQGLSTALAGLPGTSSEAPFGPTLPPDALFDGISELGALLGQGRITLEEYEERRRRLITGL